MTNAGRPITTVPPKNDDRALVGGGTWIVEMDIVCRKSFRVGSYVLRRMAHLRQ